MNNISKRQGIISCSLVLAILVIDQIIKIWIKTNMCLDESIRVTDWFYIRFIENNGMAWGMTFFNKLVLSVFRIVAVGCIGWYIAKLIRKGTSSTLFIILLSMVLAGAAGNIFDSVFYGLIFDASTPFDVAQFVPFGQGYGEVLTGKVVDMFYFPLIVSTFPDWMPIVGGEDFVFFNAIFNFADASITCGVLAMLLFCRRELGMIGEKKSADEVTSTKEKEAGE